MPPPYKVRYLSWNLKNLSTNSLTRISYNQHTKNTQNNLQVYVNTIRSKKIDIMGIIEVTVLTGENAIQQITQLLQPDYDKIISTNKSYHDRKGEYNALIYKVTAFDDSKTGVDGSKATQQLIKQTPMKQRFINRVPVLFKIPLLDNSKASSATGKTLQIMTWHAPQPSDMSEQDLITLSESIQQLSNNTPASGYFIKAADPMIVAADFNISTDPRVVGQWNKSFFKSPDQYIGQFRGVANGNKTTLVKKDPQKTYKQKIVVDFDSVLANAFDNVLLNGRGIDNQNSALEGVNNHLKEFICNGQLKFIIGALSNIDLVIKDANKISDHLGVLVKVQIP